MFHWFVKVPNVSTSEIKSQLNLDIVLLDERTLAEYRSGHIRGAKNVPLNRISQYEAKGKQPHYIICQSGMRSKQAAKILAKKGLQVVNVKGGMNAWKDRMIGGK